MSIGKSSSGHFPRRAYRALLIVITAAATDPLNSSERLTTDLSLRAQDSQASWTDVRPQPRVVESTSNAGDERRYTVSYTFDEGQHSQQQAGEPAVVPLTLQHGITYVARLRARNVYDWSDWSTEVVFSGTHNGLHTRYITLCTTRIARARTHTRVYRRRVLTITL